MESREEMNGDDTELLEDNTLYRNGSSTSLRAKEIVFNTNDVIDEHDVCRQEANEVRRQYSQKQR